jgi:hypothetical protein
VCPTSGLRRRARRGADSRRRAEGTARHRQTSASHLRGGVPVCAREVIVRRRREEHRKTRRSLRGCVFWTRTGIAHIRAAQPFSAEEEVVVVQAGVGEDSGCGNAHTQHLRGASPALSVPRPHPLPLPLPSFFPPSRRPLLDMLFGFFASGPSAPCAMRQATRTSHDARQRGIARMRRRME